MFDIVNMNNIRRTERATWCRIGPGPSGTEYLHTHIKKHIKNNEQTIKNNKTIKTIKNYKRL